MMTTSDTLDLNSLITAVRENTLVLEATYKAYTPWAGGCARNSTIVVENSRVVDVCLPDAKGLIGRARWLGRIAVATALGKNIDMKEAEKPISAVLGSTKEASIVKVYVKPIFNHPKVHDKRGIIKILDDAAQLAIRRTIKDVIQDLNRKCNRKKGSVNVSQLALNNMLSELSKPLDIPEFNLLKNNTRLKLISMESIKWESYDKCRALRNNLLKIFNQLKSNIMTNDNDIMEKIIKGLSKIPIPPDLVEFKITIKVNINKNRKLGLDDQKLEKRIKAATMLLATTPFLAGLGAITSRGFGRFCITNYNIYHYEKELSDLLAQLKCENLSKLSIYENKDLIINLHLMLGKLLLEVTTLDARHGHTPILDPSLIEVVPVEANMYAILNRISKSVTKQCWKTIAQLNPKKPGANLHTWLLGLPRRQTTGGYTITKNRSDKFCNNELIGDPGRRPSLIHIYPIFSTRQLVNVIVTVYKSGDLKRLLANENPRLYHVGRYIIGYKIVNNKKVPQFGKYHYVAVNKLAFTRIVKDPCATKHSEKHREYGGIQSPQGIIQGELLDTALTVARDFVVRGLEGC
ncbi:MAG: hypothetical protein F7C07_07525 [Desulfurococcales archaeon]|nr:hypothetical protein [Desulfurococcales archaeon]